VKTADASDIAASTFTFTSSSIFEWILVTLHRCSGVDISVAPVYAIQNSGATPGGDPATAPTITTPAANSLIFWGLWDSRNDGADATADKGALGVTFHDTTLNCSVCDFWAVIPTQGATTGAVITTSEDHQKEVHSVAFTPLPDTTMPFRTMLTARGRQ
jgi:hypothetical protein